MMFTFSILDLFCKFCPISQFGIMMLSDYLPAVYSQKLYASGFSCFLITHFLIKKLVDYRDVFRTQSNFYDRAFFRKRLTTESSILNVPLDQNRPLLYVQRRSRLAGIIQKQQPHSRYYLEAAATIKLVLKFV